MNIIEVIEEKYSSLTRKQKHIADYMYSHAEDMCFMTLKTLSETTGVSEMTILKLCGVLECGSYNALKQAFRDLTGTQSRASARETDYTAGLTPQSAVDDPSGLFTQICQEELDGVNDFLRGFSVEEYRKAARQICRARRVMLVGSGVSNQMAEYLHSRLTASGIACYKVDAEREGEVQSALYLIDEDTLVMPLYFPTYPVMVYRLAKYAKAKGADLLGMTDSTRAKLAGVCNTCLYCPIYNHLFADSQTTAVMAANLLTMAVGLEKDSMDRKESADLAINRIFEDI